MVQRVFLRAYMTGRMRGLTNGRVRARVVAKQYSQIQAKGSSKIVAAVVAIRDLEAGTELRRLKAGAAQRYPRDGGNNIQFKL